jgi:hypothetical protein
MEKLMEKMMDMTATDSKPGSRTAQLPLIVGKPFVPKKVIKAYERLDREYKCKDVGCAKAECREARATGQVPSGMPSMVTHTQQVGDKHGGHGSGWLERKANGEIVYHTPWTKKHVPFRDTREAKNLTPKPRIETSEKALVRLRKECTKKMVEPRCISTVGRDCGDGYVLVATNGHWALLEPKAQNTGLIGIGTSSMFGDVSKSIPNKLYDPELYCAVERAAVMADERSKTVNVCGLVDTIALYSSDSAVGDFVETVDCQVTAAFSFACDHDYLLMVLGCWPLTMYYRDEESAVVFEPLDKSWRFVLMPMRMGVVSLSEVREIVDG